MNTWYLHALTILLYYALVFGWPLFGQVQAEKPARSAPKQVSAEILLQIQVLESQRAAKIRVAEQAVKSIKELVDIATSTETEQITTLIQKACTEIGVPLAECGGIDTKERTIRRVPAKPAQ